ncbi:MAG: hypothetical protein WDO19_30885 [Bacteroidota bacterium]
MKKLAAGTYFIEVKQKELNSVSGHPDINWGVSVNYQQSVTQYISCFFDFVVFPHLMKFVFPT